MKLKSVIALNLLLVNAPSFAAESVAPTGLRPCCAFGIHMKSELGVIPVPFFKVDNIVELSDLEQHRYNDGSQGVTSSLLGTGDEKNGLIYTSKGGIIDTAHVRDTADYTAFLYTQIKDNLGTDMQIVLDDELRSRVINLTQQTVGMTADEQKLAEIQLSALLAFRLAQWHEIAQWFGFTSVKGFKEYPSAFSPEDLYSNMLGSIIAIEVLQNLPELTKETYQVAFTEVFQRKLQELGAQDYDRTEKIMNDMDGAWWDSGKRLPDKWVVKTRDYTPRLTIKPNWGDTEERVTLSLEPLANLESWGYLTLVASKKEKNFSELPSDLTSKKVWVTDDFTTIAKFAKSIDDKHELNRNELLPPY